MEVGHDKHTDETGCITLPNHFRCPENTVASLIDTIYSGINQIPTPDAYFAEHTILTSHNDDVDDINEEMLKLFPGKERVFISADSVKDNGEGELLYPVEHLSSINCSGLPLSRLKLKVGCPVMILRNLNPGEGVCNGMRAIVTRMSNQVLEVQLLTGEHA